MKSGELWVLGDNRNNSSDSRAWVQGRGAGVPYENVKGRAFMLWLGFSSDGQVAWDRIGMDLLGPPQFVKAGPPELAQHLSGCLSRRPTNTFPPSPSP